MCYIIVQPKRDGGELVGGYIHWVYKSKLFQNITLKEFFNLIHYSHIKEKLLNKN